MKTSGGWGYSPGVDGYFLTERVSATFAAGRQARIPLLAGWNSSELSMAIVFNPQKPTPASFTADLAKQFGDQAEAAQRAYPASTEAETLESAAALAGDMFIAYSTWRWIETHARTGQAPVYRYRFDRIGPDPSGGNKYGAVHAVEIEYAFNTLDSKKGEWHPEDRRVAETMAQAFANFVKTGSPNGPGVPEWPEYGKTRQVMYLDSTSKAGPEQHRARYELIDQVAPK
jgi:para-nitrobenzyl esterase